MAIEQGTKFKLYELASGGTKKLIANLRSNGINFEGETIDISTKESNNWRQYMGGYRSFSIEANGLVDFDAGGSKTDASALLAHFMNNTTLTVVSESDSGGPSFEGDTIISNFDITADHENAIEFTLTLQGTGAITITP